MMHSLALFGINFDHMRPWLESGGYTLLFGFLVACGMGLPVPEDVPLTTAGFLIAQQHMHLWIVAPVAWLGIMGGDTVLYFLGYRFGRNITRVPLVGNHVTLERIEKVEKLFEQYGIWVVAVGRIFAGIRGAMVVTAGTTRYNYFKFIAADGLAAILSGGMFVALGIWFGNNMEVMKEKSEEFFHLLLILFVLVVIGLAIYIRWRMRHRQTVAEAVEEKVEEKLTPGGNPPDSRV